MGMLCVSVGTCYSHCRICPDAWNHVSFCCRTHGILSMGGGNACCSMWTSCLECLWLSMVRGPKETSLWIWKVLHSCWLSWASLLSCGKIETSPPWVQLQIFVLSSVWQLGTSFCEVWQGHHCCTEGCPLASWEKCYPPIGSLLLEPVGKVPPCGGL